MTESLTTYMNAETLYHLGMALIFAGILTIIVAMLLLFFSNFRKSGRVKGGGAIIIGPVPIVFGTDKESLKMILLLSLALTVLLTIVTVIFYLMSR